MCDPVSLIVGGAALVGSSMMKPDTSAAEAAAAAEKERARKEKEAADNALRQERRDGATRPNRSRFESTNPGFFGPRTFFAAA